MSVADASPRNARPLPRQSFGTIVVVGGGCYGSYYVRQLARARRAGAIEWERLEVVDRDAACRVASEIADGSCEAHASEVSLVTSDWSGYLDRYLGRCVTHPDAASRDAIVPSPLMPHLAFGWLLERARGRWPGRSLTIVPLASELPVPWQRGAPDGTHVASFAEWVCPVNCIEPATCPKTRAARSWSMPVALRDYVMTERLAGRALADPVILHCRHRAYGVGMFDTAEVLAADRLVASAGSTGPASVLVATVSHCHGVIHRLEIGAIG